MLNHSSFQTGRHANIPAFIFLVFEEINGNMKYNIFLAESPHNKTTGDFEKITVPEHHCFVLGDNRNLSRDSRDFGPVPLATIKGRADYIYWPAMDWSHFGKIE